jgi:hypothetical protein
MPSTMPSDSPQFQPTETPFVRPTRDPTTTPTFAPTDDCEHFYVGTCPCNNGSHIDLLILIDGSKGASSIFDDIVNYLSTQLDNILPEEARLAVVTYSTLPDILFNLDNTFTQEQQMQEISTLESGGGATWTEAALELTLESVFGDSNPWYDEDRDMITMLITDGDPSDGQDPCEHADGGADKGPVRDAYDAAGVDIIPIAIDNPDIEDENWHSTLRCLSQDGRFRFRHYDAPSEDDTTALDNMFYEIFYETLDICHNDTTTLNPWFSLKNRSSDCILRALASKSSAQHRIFESWIR